ncbi:MarR family winged helix-turn-helix transcriptional regulator [Streptomyces hokutonensis]|uniref:MarR family winged helix-turn-helix transcriptional regulator n=1 Tax=Streptomyces hokutonensis TaxID=1306990 RepID=UPI003824EE0E
MTAPGKPTLPQLADELPRVVWTLHRLLRQKQETPAGEHPRPPAQVELLRLVESEPGISVREVAETLRMQANNVSTLVSQLVKAGYLDRRPHPDDRRIVQLYPTEKMHATSVEIAKGLSAGVTEALEQLSPQARKRLAAALPDLAELGQVLARPS